MANEEVVKNETIDQDKVITRPGLLLGWNAKGEFMIAFLAPWMDGAKANAYLDKAKEDLLKELKTNIPPQQLVAPASGIPADVLKNALVG